MPSIKLMIHTETLLKTIKRGIANFYTERYMNLIFFIF